MRGADALSGQTQCIARSRAVARKRKKPPHWAETFHISEIPCEVFASRPSYFLAAFFFGAAFFTAFFFTGI